MTDERPNTRSCLSRRVALSFGLTAAVVASFSRWSAGAQTGVPAEVQARFLRWSRTATGFVDLTAADARTYLEWMLRSGVTLDSVSGLDADAYRGTPLERRLLEAWYTGVFKFAGSSETRSYDTTLMWRAAGIDPSPTTCNGGPERWASAPSNL